MRTMPEKIVEIAEWLARRKVALVKGNENRRIDSTKSHTKLLQLLQGQKSFAITPHPIPSAGWYSFTVEGSKDKVLPVKIKVSSFARADNLNCKLGIYHALTGVRPDFTDEITWGRYFSLLKANLNSACNEDFYFLVVNRLDPSQVFCNSLKGLQIIRPNGSNVPFQCKWTDNLQPSQRSNVTATKYILEKLGESASLRAEMFNEYNKHFKNDEAKS